MESSSESSEHRSSHPAGAGGSDVAPAGAAEGLHSRLLVEARSGRIHPGTVAELDAVRRRQGTERLRSIRAQLEAAGRTDESLARLRLAESLDDLVELGVRDLARCCALERASIAQVKGSHWRIEAVWSQHATPRRGPLGMPCGYWTPLAGGDLERRIVRRMTPVLAWLEIGDVGEVGEGTDRRRRSWWVAAPIVAGGRAIGFVEGDCADSGRPLTHIDRDNVARFAHGFGLVFERAVLLGRLRHQRARAREAFGTVERRLAGLDDVETVLVRGERRAVSVVRTAAGLVKTGASPLDRTLTRREREVVELMVEGASNRQIANTLVVSETTVKSHARNICRKLRASSRADAVSAYLQLRNRCS